jgi:hypothetical protein
MELQEDRGMMDYPIARQEIGRTNRRRSESPIQDKCDEKEDDPPKLQELEGYLDPRRPSVVRDYQPGRA